MEIIHNIRTLDLNGKRTGIRLDAPTWELVDWIAGQQKKKWFEWAREEILKYPEAANMTVVLRAAVSTELLKLTKEKERLDKLDAVKEQLIKLLAEI